MASKGFRSASARRVAAFALAALSGSALVGSVVLRAPAPADASGTTGYWLAGTDGGVFNYGGAQFYGSAGAVPLNSPIVAFVPTPTGAGYWMAAGDGGIFAFGDARFLGSMGGQPLNKPIASMAATPTGAGYWLVSGDGGVFAFGDAAFHGSAADQKTTKPVVDFAVSPTGLGYWMVTSDGAVFAFGDAGFYGSVGAVDLSKRIQAMAPTPSGGGYWLVAGDGGIFAFGDARYLGAAAGEADKRVVDIASTATGNGYYIATSAGKVLPYGDAAGFGDASGADLNNRITALATAGTANGLRAVDDTAEATEDATATVDVLANDKDPAGGPLTLQSVSPPAHGRAEVAGGRVRYQPSPDYHGPDRFTYTATGADGATTTGTVAMTVASVDDKPEAVDDTTNITDGNGTTVPVVANDKGLGDGLKGVWVTKDPGHGEAVVYPDQSINYSPAQGFSGADSLEYEVKDTDGESSRAKLTITIGGVNHVPEATNDALTLRSGRNQTVDVTANDTVADGVREIRFPDPAGAPTDAPDASTAAGGIARRLGTKISYTAPSGGFTGSDSFTYVVVDNDGEVSQPATVGVSVVANRAPQVKNGSAAVPQGRQATGSIAKLGWDPEKDSVTFLVRSSPSGQLTLRPDGGFLYQAPTGVDADTFTFVANDGNADSNVGTVTIQVTQAQSVATTTTTGAGSSSTKPAKKKGPSGTRPKSSSGGSTTTTTRALLPVLPLAAAPAVLARRRGRRRRG